jgi:hypothetical protein
MVGHSLEEKKDRKMDRTMFSSKIVLGCGIA